MLKCIHKLYTAFAMLANMTHWMNKCMQADPAIPVNSTNHTSTFPHFSTNHTSPSHSFQPITHTHHTYFNQSYSHFSQYSTKHIPPFPNHQASRQTSHLSFQALKLFMCMWVLSRDHVHMHTFHDQLESEACFTDWQLSNVLTEYNCYNGYNQESDHAT